jgi:hypothetical protein
MIHHRIIRTIRVICLICIARVIRRKPLTRAQPSAVLKRGSATQSGSAIQSGSATQSFAKGDPIIQLTLRSGQRVTIHAGHLPEDVLGRLFGDQDVPFSSIGGAKDPCGAGMSRVTVGQIEREMDRLVLFYVRRSAQQKPLFLQFPPTHRHVLDALCDGERLVLICSFAQEPGVAEIGVFSPA